MAFTAILFVQKELTCLGCCVQISWRQSSTLLVCVTSAQAVSEAVPSVTYARL